METPIPRDPYIYYNPIGNLDLKGEPFKTGIFLKSYHFQNMNMKGKCTQLVETMSPFPPP
jgi:hypothetical protein